MLFRWAQVCGIALGWVLVAGPVSAGEPGPRAVRVVASFYPMLIATMNVVGDLPGVSLHCMAQPTAGCLHDYQMTTDDMTALASADVVVVNGAGMEAFLDRAVRRLPGLKVVDASRGIPLLQEASGPNPHVWVSVSRHELQVANIAEGLAAIDPARADRYRSHAGAYTNRLEALRVRMQDSLKGLARRDIVTFHEAFPYFADEFGLHIAAVVEHEPGTEPSARELAQTVTAIRRAGVRALFTEPQYPSKAAATLARETGAGVYVLDPVVSGPPKADAYVEAMEANLAQLLRALK